MDIHIYNLYLQQTYCKMLVVPCPNGVPGLLGTLTSDIDTDSHSLSLERQLIDKISCRQTTDN